MENNELSPEESPVYVSIPQSSLAGWIAVLDDVQLQITKYQADQLKMAHCVIAQYQQVVSQVAKEIKAANGGKEI